MYYFLFANLYFANSIAPIIAAPITKNRMLNVLKFIASCGTFNVVGPITIAYKEPIINPIIVYTV